MRSTVVRMAFVVLVVLVILVAMRGSLAAQLLSHGGRFQANTHSRDALLVAVLGGLQSSWVFSGGPFRAAGFAVCVGFVAAATAAWADARRIPSSKPFFLRSSALSAPWQRCLATSTTGSPATIAGAGKIAVEGAVEGWAGVSEGRSNPLHPGNGGTSHRRRASRLRFLVAQAVSSGSAAPAPPRPAPSGPTFNAIVKFVLPAFCLVVANSSMTAVDKMFIGRTSSLELAALGPASAAFDSTSYLLTFFNTATMSLLGSVAGNADAERRLRSHALVLAQGSAFVLAGFLIVFAEPICRALGATTGMLPYSMAYLRMRAIGAPIERGCSVATVFCLARKDGTTPFIVTLVGLVFNVLADAALCPGYGSTGVAIASVIASGVGCAYLFWSLGRSGLWPSPMAWPTSFRDIVPFVEFAGPVLAAVFLKTTIFANMTACACLLGTSAAAAHQIFLTFFFLSAVALGNPFSWAAQAFLPPIMAQYRVQKSGEGSESAADEVTADAADAVEEKHGDTGATKAEGGRQMVPQSSQGDLPAVPRQVLRRLVVFAAASATIASFVVVVMCRTLNWSWSTDPKVQYRTMASSVALVPFCILYPLLLTLEGALYSAQRKLSVLAISFAFWCVSTGVLAALKRYGLLTLSTLWLGSGFACGVTLLLTAPLALRAMGPTRRDS